MVHGDRDGGDHRWNFDPGCGDRRGGAADSSNRFGDEQNVRRQGGTNMRAWLNYAKWIAHFERNRLYRTEPDWSAPVSISQPALAPLVRSLEQFRLGDGGGPASLIAHDAERFRSQTGDMRALVDLW